MMCEPEKDCAVRRRKMVVGKGGKKRAARKSDGQKRLW